MRAPMKFACLPYMMVPRGEVTIPRWCEFAAETGLDGLDILDTWLNDGGQRYSAFLGSGAQAGARCFQRQRIEQVKEGLRGSGLPVATLTVHNNLYRTTDAERREECDRFRPIADLARELGAGRIRVVTSGWSFGEGNPEPQDAISHTVETVRQLLAAFDDLRLMLENQAGLTYRREHLGAILQQVNDPRFGANIDNLNTVGAGEDPEAFILDPRIGPRLMSFHFNDGRRTPDGWDTDLAVGEGDLPLREVFMLLRRSMYRNWMSLFYAGHDLEGVRRSVQFAIDQRAMSEP